MAAGLAGLIAALGAGAALASPVGPATDRSRAPLASAQGEPVGEEAVTPGVTLRWAVEGKAHLRDSERIRLPVNFDLADEGFPRETFVLETVSPGTHLDLSALTLLLDASWGSALRARAKIDVVDLHDRNPTSSDRKVDIDELWLRWGQETATATLPARAGAYLKLGKLPKFERQDDRHLESYGLVATAFNRFEDIGIEAGAELAHVYLKATVTEGNPVFLRDPDALAGDHGTPDLLAPGGGRALGSGVPILYDTETEDVASASEPEVGAGVGVRWAGPAGVWGLEALAWGYRRELAPRAELYGTFYGGDLDLLRGPFDRHPFPIRGDDKREVGGNLWAYRGGASLFVQVVDQDLAGLGRQGLELEGAWSFELPLRWAVAGEQLLPRVAPALRYSRLEHDFRSPPVTPSPSLSWDWQKWDAGVRLILLSTADLTLEIADHEFVLGSGRRVSRREALATLSWRVRGERPVPP